MEIFTFLWHPQSVSAYMNKFKDKKTFIDLYGNLSFPEGLKKVYFLTHFQVQIEIGILRSKSYF